MTFPLNSHSRILVVGTSGSGKSTLACEIAKKLGIPDIELDALFWKSHWTQSGQEEFRNKILAAIENKPGFVIHGNYNKVRDLTWGNSEVVLWLDYSRLVVMWRVVKRSVLRIVRSEKLWADNQESFRKTFLSKDSIILFSWKTYRLRKRQYLELIQNPEYSQIKVIRLRSPKQASQFLASI